MAPILLRVTGPNAFDANAQAEPPDRQLAQMKQSVRRSERNPIIAADVGWQAALLKKPFKYGKSVNLRGWRKALRSTQKTAGTVGDRQRIAVLAVAQQKLAFVIGAPKFVGPLAWGKSRPLSTRPGEAATFDQLVTIQHCVDGALGRDLDAREPANQALADFTSTPAGVLLLHIQDVVLYLKGQLMGVSGRPMAPIREPLHTALLIAVEDLITGLSRDAELPAKFRHGLAG